MARAESPVRCYVDVDGGADSSWINSVITGNMEDLHRYSVFGRHGDDEWQYGSMLDSSSSPVIPAVSVGAGEEVVSRMSQTSSSPEERETNQSSTRQQEQRQLCEADHVSVSNGVDSLTLEDTHFLLGDYNCFSSTPALPISMHELTHGPPATEASHPQFSSTLHYSPPGDYTSLGYEGFCSPDNIPPAVYSSAPPLPFTTPSDNGRLLLEPALPISETPLLWSPPPWTCIHCQRGASCGQCEGRSVSSQLSMLYREEAGQPYVASKDSAGHSSSMVVLPARSERPADMSQRLAALVGELTKDEQPKRPGLTILSDALKTDTVRPPSNKQRFRRGKATIPRSAMPMGASPGGIDFQAGIRKAGRPKKIAASLPHHHHHLPHPAMDAMLARKAPPGSSDFILKQQLLVLASAVAEGDQAKLGFMLTLMREEAIPAGRAMQRLAYHFSCALAVRVTGSGLQASLANLMCSREAIAESQRLCGQKMPYVNFMMDAVALAMVQTVLGESSVHIVDIGMWQGWIWPSVLRQLAGQPGGPPKLRVTAIDSPWTGNLYKKVITRSAAAVGREIGQLATDLGITFEFHVLKCRLENLRSFMIRKERGECLAVMCVMRLQNMFDHTAGASCPKDMLLQCVRELSPKAFIVTDLDADLNASGFMDRCSTVLELYHSFFEVSELVFDKSPTPSSVASRVAFEKEYLGRDIANILACEGTDRVIRIDSLDNWMRRLNRLGFSGIPFSQQALLLLKRMLRFYSPGFDVAFGKYGTGVQMLWKGRPMFSTSIWEPFLNR